jgi:hypothetical protein
VGDRDWVGTDRLRGALAAASRFRRLAGITRGPKKLHGDKGAR